MIVFDFPTEGGEFMIGYDREAKKAGEAINPERRTDTVVRLARDHAHSEQ